MIAIADKTEKNLRPKLVAVKIRSHLDLSEGAQAAREIAVILASFGIFRTAEEFRSWCDEFNEKMLDKGRSAILDPEDEEALGVVKWANTPVDDYMFEDF